MRAFRALTHWLSSRRPLSNRWQTCRYFLEKGYAVLFLHRAKSLEPFARHFSVPQLLAGLSLADGDGQPEDLIRSRFADHFSFRAPAPWTSFLHQFARRALSLSQQLLPRSPETCCPSRDERETASRCCTRSLLRLLPNIFIFCASSPSTRSSQLRRGPCCI